MKVITLWQPWATLVILGWKSIETRLHPRFASLEGQTIAIHAGLKWDDAAINLIRPHLTSTQKELLPSLSPFPKGKIIGIADVVEHREVRADESWRALIDCGQTKRYGLILNNVCQYDAPIPAKGKQGIWNYDPKEITP